MQAIDRLAIQPTTKLENLGVVWVDIENTKGIPTENLLSEARKETLCIHCLQEL